MKAYWYKTHTNGSENQRIISPSDKHILTVAAHHDLQVEGFTLPVLKKSTMTVGKMIMLIDDYGLSSWEKNLPRCLGGFVQSSSPLSWLEVDFSKSVSLTLSMRQGVDKTKKTTLKFTLDCSSVRWVERPFGGSFPWLKKEILHHVWAWSETNVWKRYLKGNAKLCLRAIVLRIQW